MRDSDLTLDAVSALDIGPIVDSHIHLWDPLTTPRQGSAAAKVYRRAPAVVNRLFPVLAKRADRLFVQTPDYVARPFLVQEYLRLAQPRSSTANDKLGLPDTQFSLLAYVHIEANWVAADNAGYVNETHWVHAQCTQHQHEPAAGAYVVHADPRDPAIAAAIDAHRAVSSKVAGVRFAGSNHPDAGVKDWVREPHLYADPAFLRGFAAIAEAGWTFDAWVYDHQLDDVAVLAAEYPETTFILDHYGTPVGLVGPMSGVPVASTDRIAKWRDKLARLAELPNVVAKHSGFGMPVLGHHSNTAPNDFVDMMTPHIACVTDLFGPDRVMFGSNTPMDLPVTDYPTLISTVAIGVRESAGEEAWSKVFRENAARVYAFDETVTNEGV